MSPTLPKEQLLIKLMGMTTSANDAEALVAVRKANELLSAAGWSWERLIGGKIVIVADPFLNAPSFEARPAAPPPAPPKPRFVPIIGSVSNPLSTTPNKFVDFCWCCGKETVAGAGFIRKDPSDRWAVVCTPCNTGGYFSTNRAPRVKTPRRASINDLA